MKNTKRMLLVFGVVVVGLAAGCPTQSIGLSSFCANQYQDMTLNGIPIGEEMVGECLAKMSVCSPEELGNETDNLARGYTPPCNFLEAGACKTACLEFSSMNRERFL